MQQIRVGRSPFIGGAVLLIAALNLALFIVEPNGAQVVAVVLFGFAGYRLLAKPYLIVGGTTVQIMSRLGFPLRALPFASPHDLQIEGRTLWVQTSVKREKISGTAANARHWRALAEAIGKAQAETPRASA